MADISSLAAQIQEWERSANLWNSIRIGLMALAAIFGLLVVIASIIATGRANYLAELRQKETQLKEEQRQRESEEARKEIEATKASTAQANERTEDVKKENLKLGIELEKEKLARLEIQRQLAERVLAPNERNTLSQVLRPYAGQNIRIHRPGDTEARPYANQIIEVFWMDS